MDDIWIYVVDADTRRNKLLDYKLLQRIIWSLVVTFAISAVKVRCKNLGSIVFEEAIFLDFLKKTEFGSS